MSKHVNANQGAEYHRRVHVRARISHASQGTHRKVKKRASQCARANKGTLQRYLVPPCKQEHHTINTHSNTSIARVNSRQQPTHTLGTETGAKMGYSSGLGTERKKDGSRVWLLTDFAVEQKQHNQHAQKTRPQNDRHRHRNGYWYGTRSNLRLVPLSSAAQERTSAGVHTECASYTQ